MDGLSEENEDKKFVIVLFKNANELGVVPSNWIKNGLCAWPPQKDKKGYARRRIPPCLNWVKYEVKQYESYDTYEEADLHLKDHFMSSDLESESLANSNKPAIKRPRKPKDVFDPSPVSQKRITPRRAEPEEENPSEEDISDVDIPNIPDGLITASLHIGHKDAIDSNGTSASSPINGHTVAQHLPNLAYSNGTIASSPINGHAVAQHLPNPAYSNGTSASSPINGHTVAQHLPNPAYSNGISASSPINVHTIAQHLPNPAYSNGTIASSPINNGHAVAQHLPNPAYSNGTIASSPINGHTVAQHLPNPAYSNGTSASSSINGHTVAQHLPNPAYSNGTSASSPINGHTVAQHLPNPAWSDPGISHGWYSPNRSSYQSSAYNSHFPLTSASSSSADYETHDSPITNTADPAVIEGSPKTLLDLDTQKSHNSSVISSREFGIVIKGMAKLTLLSEEILQQMKEINTRLANLEEREANMEGIDDIAFPDLPLADMTSFDLLEAKLKDESFKKAFMKKIKRLGGKDLKDVVFTAWHFILSVELRAKFNWLGNPRAGKETKRGLENTNVKKAVFDVIEQLSSFTNNFDVIKLTKNAIRHAPQTAKGLAN